MAIRKPGGDSDSSSVEHGGAGNGNYDSGTYSGGGNISGDYNVVDDTGGGSSGGGGGSSYEGEVGTPTPPPAPSIVAATANPSASVPNVNAASINREEALTNMTGKQQQAIEARGKQQNVSEPDLTPSFSGGILPKGTGIDPEAQVNEVEDNVQANTLNAPATPKHSQTPNKPRTNGKQQQSTYQPTDDRSPRQKAPQKPRSQHASDIPDIIDPFPYLTPEQIHKMNNTTDSKGRKIPLNMEDINNNRFDPYNSDFMVNAYVRPTSAYETDEELRDRLRSAQRDVTYNMRNYSHPDYDPEHVSYRRTRYRNQYGEPVPASLPNTLEASLQPNKDESFASPEDSIPRKQTRRETVEKRYAESQEANSYRRMNPLASLWIKGTKFVESEIHPGYKRIEFPNQDVKNAISLISNLYNCSISTVFGLVMDAATLGVDNNHMLVGTKPSEYEITPEKFVRICNQIYDSQMANGHPFSVVGQYNEIGGTYCYPSGYIDNSTAREITRNAGSALYGISTAQIQKMVADEWNETTYKNLIKNTHKDGNLSQRYSIANYIRGQMALDGNANYDSLHVTPPNDRTYYEYLQDQAMREDGLEAVVDQRQKQQRIAEEHLRRQNFKIITDSSGKVTEYVPRKGAVTKITQPVVTFQRVAGIMDPAIAVSGFTEHVYGSYKEKAAESIFVRTYNTDAATKEKFIPNDYLRTMFKSEEALQTMLCLQMLLEVGGMDAVKGFIGSIAPNSNTSGIVDKDGNLFRISIEQVQDYLNEYVRGIDNPTKLDKATQTLSRWTEMILTGGGITRGLDTQRFLEAFLSNQLGTELNGNPSMDVAGIEESIRSQGLTRTMCDMASQNEGKDALLAMGNLTYGRRGPISCAVDLLMKKHGITDFVFANAVDKYLAYSLRWISLQVPMMNCINWLITQGIVRANRGAKVGSFGWDVSREAVNNTMGVSGEGMKADWQGFRKCLIYDLTQLGSTAATGMLWYTLHKLFPPDDDKFPDKGQISNWREWAFGGTKLIPAWWTNDLAGWGFALGTAMYVQDRTNDPSLAWKVFVNATADAMEGSAIFDSIQVIMDTQTNIEQLNRMLFEEGYEPPEEWKERSMLSYGEQAFASFVRNSTPAIIRNGFSGRDAAFVGNDAKEHSTYQEYDFSKENAIADNRKKRIDDYDDVLIRTWSKNNPLYGMWNNLTHYGIEGLFGKFENDGEQKTGYMYDQMPIATKADQVALSWFDKLNIPDDYKSWPTEQKDQAARNTIEIFSQFSSYEEALAHGFILPWNARENLKEYCTAEKIRFEKEYLDAEQNGTIQSYAASLGENADSDYLASRLVSNRVSQYKAEMGNILDNWVYNDKIPSRIDVYQKYITDTEVNYVWKDSGEPATVTDWIGSMFSSDPKVIKTYTQLGNHPTSYFPFTTVETKDRGYNEETKPFWYREGVTDVNKILGLLGDTELKMGQDKGQLLGPTIMGSQDPFNRDMNAEQRIPSDGSQSPTIGRRSYVYVGEANLPKDFDKEDKEAAAARYGIDYAKFEQKRNEIYNGVNKAGSSGGKSYSSRSYGSSYSGGSGGGSSRGGVYNPKIYSSKQRVYSNKAQGMDVRQPYKATNTYLRPGFSTKGSREAYKRSDI